MKGGWALPCGHLIVGTIKDWHIPNQDQHCPLCRQIKWGRGDYPAIDQRQQWFNDRLTTCSTKERV